jgi:DNA (cytosine-5)-methyltransferase 1
MAGCDVAVLPIIALCAGGGGLERGLAAGLGDAVEVRPVLYVEREAFAAAHLASEMESGRLAPAPIWSDLTDIPDGVLRELRDVAPIGVTAGFPCQPWSAAGKRRGTADERWIWDDIARILREVRPSLVFLENVSGLTRGGIEHVLATLAEIGMHAEWGVFRASDVGAPHQRARLFILAVSDAFGGELWPEQGRGEPGWPREAELGYVGRETVGDSAGAPAKDRAGEGGTSGGALPTRSRGRGAELGNAEYPNGQRSGQQKRATGGRRPAVADAEDLDSREVVIGESEAAFAGTRLPLFPPGPAGVWADIPWHLWPALTREEEAELEVRSLADESLVAHRPRVDMLRLLGNAVVPAQAALAVRVLCERLRLP